MSANYYNLPGGMNVDDAVALGESDNDIDENADVGNLADDDALKLAIGRHHSAVQALRATRGWQKRRRGEGTSSPAVLQVLNSNFYAVRDHDDLFVPGERPLKRSRTPGSVQMFKERAFLRAAFAKAFECAKDVAKRFPQSNGKPASDLFIGQAKKAVAIVLHSEVKKFVTELYRQRIVSLQC